VGEPDFTMTNAWDSEEGGGGYANDFLRNARIEIHSKKDSNVFWKGEGWRTAPKRPRNIGMPYQWLFSQEKKLGFPNRLDPDPSSNKTRVAVLDYGCGRGQDAMRFGFEKYDPNWFPDSVWDPVRLEGHYDFIFCIYVLDVIKEPKIRHEIMKDIRRLLKPGTGEAYIINRCDEYATMKDGQTTRKTVDSSWDLHRVEAAREYDCAEIYRNYFFQVWVTKSDGAYLPPSTVELDSSWPAPT
jgi:hypothetical protein